MLKRESSYSCSLTPRLIPGFWVKLDIPKHLGGNEKRFGCPLLNFTLNRITQTRRYIRLLAPLKLGNVLPGEAELYSSIFRAIPAIGCLNQKEAPHTRYERQPIIGQTRC